MNRQYPSRFVLAATLCLGAAIFLLTAFFLSPAAQAEDGRDRTISRPDTIVVVEQPSTDGAIAQLESGAMHIYGFQVSNPAIAAQIEASPNLDAYRSFGSYMELTFNPSGPIFTGTGKLNPFARPRVRQAMNYLVDRDFIAQEIYGGLAAPRWHALNNGSHDYADLSDAARALELQYAYNKPLAAQLIGVEMVNLGAVMLNGVWHYAGEPVEIILLIRIEDERLQIGDYVADQLEDIGFVVTRDYKTAAQASPIWLSGDPANGLFHIYTGGWITTQIPRDLGGNFSFFYTDRGLNFPLWQAYVNTPEFYELSGRLDEWDYASVAERRAMMVQALTWAQEDSVRIWLVDRVSVTPRRAEVQYASDLYGGIAGSRLWPHTLQWAGAPDAPLVVGVPAMLTDPWNPIAGTNWLYDTLAIRATSDFGFVPDPYTGLVWPQRAANAAVTVEAGLTVRHSLPWLDLQTAPVITVPGDAWIDWDAVEQRFLTVAELYPGDTLYARSKSVVYYPADLYDTVVWHDGSPFSAADIVLRMILTFDRAKEESAVFDQAAVGQFNSFMSGFRGMRILSTEPLIIEYYSNVEQLDAELMATDWWPFYGFGPGAWHNLALGLMVEAAGEAAFSSSKAFYNDIPWLDYVVETDLLLNHLAAAQADNYIPYAPTLGAYISPTEAAARWQNIGDWYDDRGHFWIGTGRFYLAEVSPTRDSLTLQRFSPYPDPPDRWDSFAAPLIPETAVTGPDDFAHGEEAIFDIAITFDGQPYAAADLEYVRYLILSESGRVVLTGEAEPLPAVWAGLETDTGLWRVVLDPAVTERLPGGTNRLEIVVVSNRVVIPSYTAKTFTLPYHFSYLPIIRRP